MLNSKGIGNCCHNLLSLSHVLTIKTNGKEPLMDYSQSDVMILKEYLNIMWQNAMDMEVIEQIKENIRKEKQEKHL